MLIDNKLAKKLVESQFPQWANLRVRPVEVDGHDNRTFHLGDEMTVRLPSGPGYVAAVEKENRWLPVLAPHLPLPIPEVLAVGAPGEDFPWPWSVRRWVEGETITRENVADHSALARALAEFLRALEGLPAVSGSPAGEPPFAGEHNFHRGGDLRVYDGETRETLAEIGPFLREDTALLHRIWERSLSTCWAETPVWLHGDVAVGNLLVREGLLCGVIDFGTMGVGDPSSDLVMAWTFFTGESRRAFAEAMALDADTWDRARGWALWKALITFREFRESDPARAAEAARIVGEIAAEG